MEIIDLINDYKKIEEDFKPIIVFLENNKEKYPEYKGFFTLQGPLVECPEILFLGYNTGDGAYNEKTENKSAKSIPPPNLFDESKDKELEWYKKGNARGYFDKSKKWWYAYEWYERDQRINNELPKKMIDLLYNIADIKFEQKSEKNKLPFWYEDFGQKIMFTNLYPIATTKIKNLEVMLNRLAKEEELKNTWEKHRRENEKFDNWIVRKFFLARIRKMIELVNPKIIVCLGKSTMDDFVYKKFKIENNIYYSNEKVCESDVLGFSRRGNWSKNIPNIAKQIVDIQKS